MGISDAGTAEKADFRLKYIWAVEDALVDKEVAHSWFIETLAFLLDFHQPNIQRMYENTLWYIGIYDELENYQVRLEDGSLKKVPKGVVPFVIHHLGRLTQKRVADLSSYKSTFDVFAADATEKDRIRARLVKPILKDIKRKNNADMMFDQAELYNTIFGCVYVGVDWDENLGDRKGKNSKKREGQVKLKVIDPSFVLPFPQRAWEEVKCVVMIDEILSVDEARKKYKDDEIEPDGETSIFGFEEGYKESLRADEVVIWKVLHKPDQYLPEGFIGRFTRHKCLQIPDKNAKWPWSHDDFPFERYTSIDIPRTTLSVSFYSYVKPLQHNLNLVHGMVKRNIYHGAHPKWMMVKGACNFRSLGNSFTVVQHKLNQRPELMAYPTTTPEVYKYVDMLKGEMESLANQQTISTGNLPPNTRSGIMISRLQEIEKQTRGPQIDKRNDFMRRVLLKAAAVAGDYFPLTSKVNIERVVGTGNADQIQEIAKEKVFAQYSIEIINSAGFSDNLVGRMEEVGFLMEKVPGAVTQEEAMDIINFRSPDKYYDIGTASLRCAQEENEIMNDGRDVPPPESYEDLFVHWRVHFIDIQTLSFKRLPEFIQKLKLDHLEATEMLMEEAATKSQAFKQKLLLIPFWPVLWTVQVPPVDPSQTDPNAAPQGAPGEPPPTDPSAPNIPPVLPPPQVIAPPQAPHPIPPIPIDLSLTLQPKERNPLKVRFRTAPNGDETAEEVNA